MKKLLLGSIALGALIAAAPAGAADLRAPAPRYSAPPPVFSWSGFYIGGHVGGGWGTKDWTSITTAPGFDEGLHHVRGGLAGGQIGFNYQVGYWVFGVEADASWADLQGRHTNPVLFLFGVPETLNSKVDSIVTASGRLGYAVDRVLGYVKAGGAWAHDKYFLSNKNSPDTAFVTASETRSGWMAGIGLEYAFAPSWSVKFEYNHLDLGDKRNTFHFQTVTAAPVDHSIAQRLDLFKVGINYRFGGYGPVYAKY
jgi:outer membrane immunogenic protein